MKKTISKLLPSLFITIALLVAVFADGCQVYREGVSSVAKLEHIDYAKSSNWAVRPTQNNFAYDIFYIYPTVIFDGVDGKMDFALESHYTPAVANSLGATKLMSKFANIYAPLYRQSALDALAPFEDFSDIVAKAQVGIADVEDAFLYYIKNLNQGRPFIIFGHSQGSAVGYELLKKHLKTPEINKNFVAAYLSGMLLKKEDLAQYPFLKFAQNTNDTGVIMVWNVQSAEAPNNFFVQEDGLGINPANWRIDSQPSEPRTIVSATGHTYHEPQATLNPENGATIVELENPEKYEMQEFGTGVYHVGNISLFINTISENFLNRFQNFKN